MFSSIPSVTIGCPWHTRLPLSEKAYSALCSHPDHVFLTFVSPVPSTLNIPTRCSGNVWGRNQHEEERARAGGPWQRRKMQRHCLLVFKPIRRLENTLGLNIYFLENHRNPGKLQHSQQLIFITARSLLQNIGDFDSKSSSSFSKPGFEAAPWELCWRRPCVAENLAGQVGSHPFSAACSWNMAGASPAFVSAMESDS